MTEYTLTEYREMVKEKTAERGSDEADEVIHNDDTHVSEIWQDGEITTTKSGDLYGRRNLHQSVVPWMPKDVRLFDRGGEGNTRRIIVNTELRDIVKNTTVKTSINRGYLDVEMEVSVNET